MRTLLMVLSWYTIIAIAVQIVLAPVALDDTLFTPTDIVIGSALAVPILIYAVLVLVYLRRSSIEAGLDTG